MSWDEYDACPGCRPCLIDRETRQPLPDDHPTMQTMLQVWQQMSRNERAAYHRVMCEQSQHWFDLEVVHRIAQRFRLAVREKVLA